MNDRKFDDFEWIAIDNALEALIDELRESSAPIFSEVVENVVFAYDLDEGMEEMLMVQWGNLVDMYKGMDIFFYRS